MNIQVRPVLQVGTRFFPFNVTMARNSTLAQFKNEVKRRWNLHPKQQRVSYNSESLEEDYRTLSSFQIINNATVYVGFANATIIIFIRPIDPRALVKRIEADLNWTVNELKKETAKGMQVAARSQVILCLGENELEGDMPLSSLEELEDGCELSIIVKEYAGHVEITIRIFIRPLNPSAPPRRFDAD